MTNLCAACTVGERNAKTHSQTKISSRPCVQKLWGNFSRIRFPHTPSLGFWWYHVQQQTQKKKTGAFTLLHAYTCFISPVLRKKFFTSCFIVQERARKRASRDHGDCPWLTRFKTLVCVSFSLSIFSEKRDRLSMISSKKKENSLLSWGEAQEATGSPLSLFLSLISSSANLFLQICISPIVCPSLHTLTHSPEKSTHSYLSFSLFLHHHLSPVLYSNLISPYFSLKYASNGYNYYICIFKIIHMRCTIIQTDIHTDIHPVNKPFAWRWPFVIWRL